MKWFGRIVNGKNVLYRPTEHENYLRTMEGKETETQTNVKQEPVSSDQRGYFRSSIKWLIDNTESFGGHDENELYEDILKELTGYKKCVEWKGEMVEREFYKRTSDMNKKEMSKLIDDFINWLALQDIHIPSPQEAIIGKYATVTDKKAKNIKLNNIQ